MGDKRKSSELLSDDDSDVSAEESDNYPSENEDDPFGSFMKAVYSEEEDESQIDASWPTVDPPRANEDYLGTQGFILKLENADSVNQITSLFMADDLFQLISDMTNLNFEMNKDTYKKPSRSSKWTPTNAKEIKKYFALQMLMGQVKKKNIIDYWSIDPLIETPIFHKTMSRGRFFLITYYMHFTDENIFENDKMVEIQKVLDYFLNKFKSLYTPSQDLFVDENVIPWRAGISFKKRKSSKMLKHGILVRMLRESDSGYIININIYTENSNPILDDSIMSILGHRLNFWHNVYLTNIYNSVRTAEMLLKYKTRICGTVKAKRGLPTDFRDSNIAQGVIKHCRKGDILLQMWNNKSKILKILSTIHNAQNITTSKFYSNRSEHLTKPASIMDYYKHTKKAKDQKPTTFPLSKKTGNWATKVVFFLFNCAIINSYQIFCKLNPTIKMPYDKFILIVAKSWIEDTLDVKDLDKPTTSTQLINISSKFDPPGRLSGNMADHVIQKIRCEKTNKILRKRCRVCYVNKKRSDTSYMCTYCAVALHVGDCFNKYHLHEEYKDEPM